MTFRRVPPHLAKTQGATPGRAKLEKNVEPAAASGVTGLSDAALARLVFRDPSDGYVAAEAPDFMTGGNRTHNREAEYLVRTIAERVREESGIVVDPGRLREWVHRELGYFKDNALAQRNGNAGRREWSEIVQLGIERFVSGRDAETRVLETTEDVHARIETWIDAEFAAWDRGVADPEGLRAVLRTRLRAEFADLLLNETGVDRLADVPEFYREAVVERFQRRAEALLAEEGVTARAWGG